MNKQLTLINILITAIFSFILMTSPLTVGSHESGMKASVFGIHYDEVMMDGLEAFYQTEWENAESCFNLMKELDPADPRGYFFSSMIPFWVYFFVDQSEESANDFFNQSAKAIELAEEKLLSNPGDKMLISMLSGLYGYQSLVASGENQIRTALRSGRTGFSYTKQLMEFDESMPRLRLEKGYITIWLAVYQERYGGWSGFLD